jgi:hypothetical protein
LTEIAFYEEIVEKILREIMKFFVSDWFNRTYRTNRTNRTNKTHGT